MHWSISVINKSSPYMTQNNCPHSATVVVWSSPPTAPLNVEYWSSTPPLPQCLTSLVVQPLISVNGPKKSAHGACTAVLPFSKYSMLQPPQDSQLGDFYTSENLGPSYWSGFHKKINTRLRNGLSQNPNKSSYISNSIINNNIHCNHWSEKSFCHFFHPKFCQSLFCGMIMKYFRSLMISGESGSSFNEG